MKNDQKLSDILKAFSSDKKMKPNLTRKRVEAAWGEIMGVWIKKETREMSIRAGVLIIRINSAPLRQELHFKRDQIRERINEFLGENYIKEIVIR